ncbi:ArsR family transcriptional regulator [Halobacteriales archaeon QS_9_68_42]|nr:MAG: ArsR family transcriptional regulator [Halobacteriales archaeon QS_9_68_42]
MSLLPSSPDVSPDSDPRLVGLDSEEADELMAALSSETARRLLAELHEDPAPPGELADRVDTSLQNAQYHLEKLEGAGAIEDIGTAYSEKGREMTVYGPADSPLVIYAGEQERASGLRAALSRLFGGVLALAVTSLAIQELFGRSIFRAARDDAGPQGAPPSETSTATPTAAPTSGGDDGAETSDSDGSGGLDAKSTEEPTATGEVNVSRQDGTATPEPGATGTTNETMAEEGTKAAAETETPADARSDAQPTDSPTEAPADTPAATEDGGAGGGPLDFLDGVVDFFDAVLDGLFGPGLPPGLAFFVGGLTVLSVVVAMTYLRSRP